VQEALQGSNWSNNGAYLHVWNIGEKAVAVAAQGNWSLKPHDVDIEWQAFDLSYCDSGASQPAGQVGLVVGNMHIPCGKKRPADGTRRDYVRQVLGLLERVDVDSWRHRENFQVMRVLVGDCNLDPDKAFAASQRQPTTDWGRRYREQTTLRLTELQKTLRLTEWQVVSTPEGKSGDVMFILGGFYQEHIVPVGTSWEYSGMRRDAHDAVGARLLIPIRQRPADAVSQPAVAAAATQQVPPGGALQPAVAFLPLEDLSQQEPTSDDSRESSECAMEANELASRARELEEKEEVSPRVLEKLRHLLFKKRWVCEGGVKRPYVSKYREVVYSISQLLKRRQKYMADHSIIPPSGEPYLFNDEDRGRLMDEWKKEFHALPQQRCQQKRDSFKELPPNGKGKRGAPVWPGWGYNKKAVGEGMRSRFARLMQLAAGSKTMAEIILYTGRIDADLLEQAWDMSEASGAPQPAELSLEHLEKKKAAHQAKAHYRWAQHLQRRLDEGTITRCQLAGWERRNLTKLQDGSLLQIRNQAVATYGHGTLRFQNGEVLEIGGSTGGFTRVLLDSHQEPDVATLLSAGDKRA